MTWGLALGGGGPVGFAWEVGVLRGLEERGCPSAADADVIVGTSAGSMLGAWIRQGRTLADLEQLVHSGCRLPGRALPLRDEADRRLYAEALRLWARPDSMTPEQAAAVGAVAARVDREDPGRLSSLEEEFGTPWPPGNLLITSCRVRDGARWTWEAASGEPLHRAIAASCTVPGQSKPLVIGGEAHVDGGVWSSTNADLLSGKGVGAVVALSPMAGAMGLGRAQSKRLASECEALAGLGIEAVGIEPGDAFKKNKVDLLDASKADDALALGRQCADDAAERVLAVLRVTNSA